MRPRIFVGSSTESLQLAYAVQENLDRDAEITVWAQGIFGLSNYTLESLASALDRMDFAIFLLTPDDLARLRGKEHLVARDNVVLELGLFIGKLGRPRIFIVLPRGTKDIHLPTDLLGLTVADYDANRSDKNLVAALGPACNRIRNAIAGHSLLTSKISGGYDSTAVILDGSDQQAGQPVGTQLNPPNALRPMPDSGFGVGRAGYFADFAPTMNRQLTTTSRLILVFIYSRDWRTDYRLFIRQLLERGGSLDAFLPSTSVSQRHFANEPRILELIQDAYDDFAGLGTQFAGQVAIHAADRLPAYSLYRFDHTVYLSLHPEMPGPNVPTLEVLEGTPFGQFIEAYIDLLSREARLVHGWDSG